MPSVRTGLGILVGFFVIFTIFMVLRGVLPNPELLLSLFLSMLLAGTVIFGGNPLVVADHLGGKIEAP